MLYIYRILSDKLDIKDDSEKSMVLIDMYYYALNFAQSKSFTYDKTIAILSILRATHTHCCSSPFITLDKDYQFFKACLLRYCISKPPSHVQLFNLDEMKSIHEYIWHTYFRHYSLYKYTFTKRPHNDMVNVLDPSTAEIFKVTDVPALQSKADDQSLSIVPVAVTTELKDSQMNTSEAKLEQNQSVQINPQNDLNQSVAVGGQKNASPQQMVSVKGERDLKDPAAEVKVKDGEIAQMEKFGVQKELIAMVTAHIETFRGNLIGSINGLEKRLIELEKMKNS
ncbi:flagellar C1a complex subunit C1a-32-domain-containing protein [Paraphysoderma sedebokerense]|nr:flagellar C1a complex subunit C1a-32-domain-containing protein [Paraphysoderma sedebokerense]